MLYETHSHTTLCKHAVGHPDEYAQAALDAGLSGYTITCHNPMPDGFGKHVRMDPGEFEQYVELVRAAQVKWDGRLDVRLGLECDYFAGYEQWLTKQAEAADFDYLLGSVHPQLAEFTERFFTGSTLEFQRTYFEQLAMAAETGLFDCLAHPDLVKNQTADQWRPADVLSDICRALDRIAATGIAMELNTSGANKTIREMNPFPDMLREMCARKIPVVIGSDAHEPGRVGDRFGDALSLLTDCGYQHVSYFIARQRRELPIDAAIESLNAVMVDQVAQPLD